MGHWFTTLALGVAAFVSTNIDDIFVLLLFFSNPRMRPGSIVLGQFIGMLILVLASLAGAFLTRAISFEYVSLLGLLPILLGTKALLDRKKSEIEKDPPRTTPMFKANSIILWVAFVTVANGGDNISIYVPVFSTRTTADLSILIGTFMIMTGVWCAVASYLVNHPKLKKPIERYGGLAFPWVLILLGVAILGEGYL